MNHSNIFRFTITMNLQARYQMHTKYADKRNEEENTIDSFHPKLVNKTNWIITFRFRVDSLQIVASIISSLNQLHTRDKTISNTAKEVKKK